MRPVQYFTEEYLRRCRKMRPEEIVRFLEDFRTLHLEGKPAKSRLISMKVPEDLLGAFRARCRMLDMPYQTQIKRLMAAWCSPDATQA